MLMLAGEFKKDREHRRGVFAAELSEGDAKKRRWYAAQNARIAAALMDHNWMELLADMPQKAGLCCRPCC